MTDPLIGSTTAVFSISLSVALLEPVDVGWSTKDGTAKAGTDYEAASGVVTFLPGELEKQIEVTVYGQDVGATLPKNFYIKLTPPTNAILNTPLVECIITVEDDEGTPITSLIVAQGKRGLKGDPGLSAYEQAVIMGYEGTVEQWMTEIGDAAQAATRAEEALVEVEANAALAEAAASAAVFAGRIFQTAAAGVDPITGVPNGYYFNVRSASNDAYIDEYQNVNGTPTATGKSYPTSSFVQGLADYVPLPYKNGATYGLHERVMLANGDIVRSTTAGNTNNPNSNMDGWIFDKTFIHVSVADFGASPNNTAAKNNIAFSAAITYMNTRFTGFDGFLRDTPSKGILIVPADGTYEISDQFNITGNYGFLIGGTINYTGVAGVTVFTIGRQVAFDSTSDNDYLLNMYTSVADVDAFELKNMVDCRVTTMKIKGFKEALRCLARDSRSFFGNTFRLGTFDSNIIDIHIRSETSGAPNANRFYDGFFYKTRNLTVEQNCVKISSDGTYNDIDSNLFDGLNFEEGKATVEGAVDCIPINLEVGVQNRFINIRTENNSNTALARVNKRGNTIEVRAAFTTSTEIISSTVQQTLVVPQDKMQRVFTSGDLAKESVKLATSGRVWNPNITFNDANVLNQNSTLSTSSLQLFDLTSVGIKFLNTRSMLSFKVKTNGDRRFLLRTFADDYAKRLNTAIACYDAAGNRLLNDPAIAVGTWGVQQRVKSNDNVPLVVNANIPWTSTGAYITPITTFQTRLPFEVHPSVETIEIYYFWAGADSNNDITLSRFELYSIEGNSSIVDAAAPTPTTGDRWLYQPRRGNLELNLSGSSTYDPPSLANGGSVIQTFSLVGAAFGDDVKAAFSNNLQGVDLTAWVSNASIVSAKFTNNTGATVDLASGTLNFFLKRLVL